MAFCARRFGAAVRGYCNRAPERWTAFVSKVCPFRVYRPGARMTRTVNRRRVTHSSSSSFFVVSWFFRFTFWLVLLICLLYVNGKLWIRCVRPTDRMRLSDKFAIELEIRWSRCCNAKPARPCPSLSYGSARNPLRGKRNSISKI